MPAITYPHIQIRDNDAPRIEGTGVKVVMVVEAHLAEKGGAVQIQRHFPQLNDAQIYSALAYYYDNKAEIDAHLERRRLVVAETEQTIRNSPSAQRLRTIKKQNHNSP